MGDRGVSEIEIGMFQLLGLDYVRMQTLPTGHLSGPGGVAIFAGGPWFPVTKLALGL